VEADAPLLIQSSGFKLKLGKSQRGCRMATLGSELVRLRKLKGWSLRDVEDKTKKKVSNSYLYQLESDNVKQPSPNILYVLANVYEASYSDLMQLAGFVVPNTNQRTTRHQNSVAFNAMDLSEDEENQVLDFVEFLRSKKREKR
jgi:transcriptional regulator with XRE-family HTH domain